MEKALEEYQKKITDLECAGSGLRALNLTLPKYTLRCESYFYCDKGISRVVVASKD
jgi:hypothetical protein